MAQGTDWRTPFEKNKATSATYFEAIDFYQKLAAAYSQLQFTEQGMTEAGFPLHTAVLSENKNFEPATLRSDGKRILLINNAIHPGEPEGVDAAMMLVRDILQKKDLQSLLEKVVVVVIPFYNIGGGLNRGPHSRANQDGPAAYGFRGNSRNLDLNRDFIKNDTKEAQAFVQIFQRWQPDVFVDNHTSNGADYAYTMTLLTTQEDKLGPVLGTYLRHDLLPKLNAAMTARGQEMSPYVNEFKDTPADGIYGFNDSPRFSSGYAALHHCLAFVPETHMLKPWPQRVQATYDFMEVVLRTLNEEAATIGRLRREAVQEAMYRSTFPLDWKVDEARPDSILFKGYEGKYKKSEVTGLDRLWYDRSAPWERRIPFWNHFVPKLEMEKPVAYLIPQAYTAVLERLLANGVQLRRLSEDAAPALEMYYITKYETRLAYEGHYLHYDVEVEKKTMIWPYHKGDYVAFTDQPAVRFLVETLEPQGVDSYFAWNFFDGILMEKEYFSPYVFEDIAAAFLKENPAVQEQLEAKRQADAEFAGSQWAQLFFVYQRTPHFEKTLNLYPVGRWMDEGKMLPLESK